MNIKLKYIEYALYVIVLIFFGVKIFGVLSDVTVDHTDEIKKSMNKYYVSGNVVDLKPIIDIMDKDPEYVSNVQAITNKSVQSWFEIIDGKYSCDTKNTNACKVKMEENEALLKKIEGIYNIKDSEGNNVVNVTIVDKIMKDIEDNNANYQRSIDFLLGQRPMTVAEEIRKSCETASCSNCNNNGVCSCTYTDEEKNVKEVKCFKPEYVK